MKKIQLVRATLLVAPLLLTGCGNKGALYLPDPQEQLAPASAPQQPAQTPSQEQSQKQRE